MKKMRTTLANMDIRNKLKEYGIPQWMLAERLGISEFTLIRRLRHELPEETKNDLFEKIEEIFKEVE